MFFDSSMMDSYELFEIKTEIPVRGGLVSFVLIVFHSAMFPPRTSLSLFFSWACSPSGEDARGDRERERSVCNNKTMQTKMKITVLALAYLASSLPPPQHLPAQ